MRRFIPFEFLSLKNAQNESSILAFVESTIQRFTNDGMVLLILVCGSNCLLPVIPHVSSSI